MKPSKEEYDKIPPLPPAGEQFMHIPGCYCQNCGASFALYSYSILQPGDVDENGKPYFRRCGIGECKDVNEKSLF
jgi:hypothetical protein